MLLSENGFLLFEHGCYIANLKLSRMDISLNYLRSFSHLQNYARLQDIKIQFPDYRILCLQPDNFCEKVDYCIKVSILTTYYFPYKSYLLNEGSSAKLGLYHISKDGNFLHPLAVTLLVSLVRVKSTVKYIICVIKYSHVQAFIENCIQLMLLFLKIKVLVLRKCVNGSA